MPELHTAAYLGDLTMLRQRLAIDNPNARAMHGTTALMSAYYQKQEKAYSLLIQHGADPNLMDHDGHDILSLIMTRNKGYEWLPFVLRTGSVPDPVRHKGLLTGVLRRGVSLCFFGAILRASPAMVDDVDEDGCTPLHLVLRRVSLMPIKTVMVSLLLEKGADVSAKDKRGMTARDIIQKIPASYTVRHSILHKLVNAENAVWLFSVARVLQAKDRDGEFEAIPVTDLGTGQKAQVLHHVVCKLNPSLVQEIAMML